MIRRFLRVCGIGLLSLPIASVTAVAEDSLTFRGPSRTSVYDGKKLLRSWPETGPKLLWEAPEQGEAMQALRLQGINTIRWGTACRTQRTKMST